jgi:hypothetical protein
MSVAIEPAFHGQRILIVESDARFLHQLQGTLKKEGASTFAVIDPYSFAGAHRITRLIYSAAAINDWHRRVLHSLHYMPVVLYGRTAPVPAQVDAIIGELKAILGVRH